MSKTMEKVYEEDARLRAEVEKSGLVSPCVKHEYESEEYTQSVGQNIECESSIPMEEDKEPQPMINPRSFEGVYESFLNLHAQEQNEIIAEVMNRRSRQLNDCRKELERLENLYYTSLSDKL